MASTDITLTGLDEATLSDDLVTVLADPSTNGGYKASLGDLSDYVKSELDESELSMELTEVSGNPITITDASNTNCETLVATLSPTQSGTGDPSPTNVRPISGMSTLNVNRTGKNLLNGNTSVTIDTTDTKTLGSATLPTGTYTFSLKQNNSMTSNTRNTLRVTYGGSNYYESASANNQLSAGTHQMTFELTEEQEVSFWIWGQGLSTATTYSEPQVELGSSATTYEPYQGTSITLSLGSTVYGGSVDLRSGVLTVDRVAIDLASQTIGKTSGTEEDTNYIYQIGNSDLSASGDFSNPTLFMSNVMTYSSSLPSSGGQFTVRTTPGTGYFYFNIGELSTNTVASCKARLSELGAKLVYPLATPTTTQLTPQTLRLLQGNNTLWTNAEGLEVEYQPNNFVGQLKAWILDQLG